MLQKNASLQKNFIKPIEFRLLFLNFLDVFNNNVWTLIQLFLKMESVWIKNICFQIANVRTF